MGFISSVTQAPITKRSDRCINEVIQAHWGVFDPLVADIGWGEYWERSEKNSTIMTWEQPVGIELVGMAGQLYDFKIKNEVLLSVKNPEEIGYPLNLERMLQHSEDIITDQILAGVRPEGYHSMILTGHQYIRNPNVVDKAIAVIFVDMNVRCVHT